MWGSVCGAERCPVKNVSENCVQIEDKITYRVFCFHSGPSALRSVYIVWIKIMSPQGCVAWRIGTMHGARLAFRCRSALFPLNGSFLLVTRSTFTGKGKTSRLVTFGRHRGSSNDAGTDEKGNDEGERQTTHFQKDLLSKMGCRCKK